MTDVPPQASAERLTILLRRAGVLGRGHVVDVAVESSRDTLISRISRLRLTYDRHGDEGPCERADATLRDLGRKEATFYEVVATATPSGLLPRCYEAVSEPAEHWYLMLETSPRLMSR